MKMRDTFRKYNGMDIFIPENDMCQCGHGFDAHTDLMTVNSTPPRYYAGVAWCQSLSCHCDWFVEK